MMTDENCRALPVLKKQAVTRITKSDENGFTQTFPVYTGVIKLWRDKFIALGLDDIDYTKYDDILQRKPIDELDRDEVIAYLLMLMRSERHGGTRFVDAVESGKTEALCMRLQETVK